MGGFLLLVVLGTALYLWLRTRPPKAVEGRIRGDGRYGLAAVGESHYQPALRAIVGPGEVRHRCDAVLILEDDNPYSSKAVRVDVQGKTVAYLSGRNAREYRAQIAHLGHLQATCGAMIVGGGKGRSLGIWLDFAGVEEDDED